MRREAIDQCLQDLHTLLALIAGLTTGQVRDAARKAEEVLDRLEELLERDDEHEHSQQHLVLAPRSCDGPRVPREEV